MKRSSLAWNVSVVGLCLGAALAVAVGCPNASRTPSANSANVATTSGSDSSQTAARLPPAPSPLPSASADASQTGAQQVERAAAPSQESPPASTSDPPATQNAPHGAGDSSPPTARSGLDAWPRPKYVLFITGRQHGYLEPCGCAGLNNQKGGMARRHSLYEAIKSQGWEIVPLDVGNQVRRYGRQAEIQFQVSAAGLQKMDYQAVALGPDDLRLSGDELIAVLTDVGKRQSPFLCANANPFGLTKTHRVIEAGGERIGVTAILGSEALTKIQSNEIEKTSPEQALQKVLPQLDNVGCSLRVLLAYTDYNEAKSLAEKFPQFDVVIAAAGIGEPPAAPELVGQTLLILVGEKSMYTGVLGVFDDPQDRFRYLRVPLDAALADSPFMLKLLATYQDTLQAEGLEGLGLRPVAHPSGNEFVGSATCGDCHTQAYAVWQNTPHHHATESLVHPGERIEIPRHFDPECLSCHVTGWDPQGFFPFKSGYLDLEQSKHLHGNGCENCHGPGSRHVAAELGELDLDEAAKQKLRESMRLPLNQAEKKCLECHDLDNDPNFHRDGAFAEYWEQIKHYGKD